MRSAAPVADAVAGEEAARDVDVFGRDREPPPVTLAEVGGDVVEVLHGDHVDPGLGHGDDDVALAEAERRDRFGLLGESRHRLLDLVAAGDAEMDGTGADLAGDLGRRQERHLDAGEAGDAAAIAPPGARRRQLQPGPCQAVERILLEAALRRDGEDERQGHGLAPSRSSQMAKPTAGTAPSGPTRASRRS